MARTIMGALADAGQRAYWYQHAGAVWDEASRTWYLARTDNGQPLEEDDAPGYARLTEALREAKRCNSAMADEADNSN